jgi:hypothetical protein
MGYLFFNTLHRHPDIKIGTFIVPVATYTGATTRYSMSVSLRRSPDGAELAQPPLVKNQSSGPRPIVRDKLCGDVVLGSRKMFRSSACFSRKIVGPVRPPPPPGAIRGRLVLKGLRRLHRSSDKDRGNHAPR